MKIASIGGSALAASFVVLLTASAPDMARAQSISCNESTAACTGGYVGTPVQGGMTITLTEPGGASITLGSDGEDFFDPFGYGADTSDGVTLLAGGANTWTPDNSNGAFNPGFWTPYTASGSPLPTGTWVLPASTPCGAENEPACEPIAVWDYSAPLPALTLTLLEGDGVTYSDSIRIRNIGANGNAVLIFASDPSVVPEPSTWAMMCLGFAGLALVSYRASRRGAALA